MQASYAYRSLILNFSIFFYTCIYKIHSLYIQWIFCNELVEYLPKHIQNSSHKQKYFTPNWKKTRIFKNIYKKHTYIRYTYNLKLPFKNTFI